MRAPDILNQGEDKMNEKKFQGKGRLLNLLASASLALAALQSVHAQGSSSSAPSSCGSGTTGPGACVSDQPASKSDPSPTTSGSNPINTVTGNKYQREVDLPALPGVLGLEIVRHYNSDFSGLKNTNGIMGRGWKLSYETRLVIQGAHLEVIQADGRRIAFQKELMTGQASGASPSDGRIAIRTGNQGAEYTWVWPSGRKLTFDAQGKLLQIAAPTGEFVTLQYDPKGLLIQVIDPQGRRLILSYPDRNTADAGRFKGVQSIDSPVGRFVYEYGSPIPKDATVAAHQLAANLVRVQIPTQYSPDTPAHGLTARGSSSSDLVRIYHYEDARFPTFLTGISVQGKGGKLKSDRIERLATYGYDDRGWATRSVHGYGIELAHIDRADDRHAGHTVLVHSKTAQAPQGQKLEIWSKQIAGAYRITETRGLACPAVVPCPEANMRYHYDEHGQVIESIKLDQQGLAVQGLRTEYDVVARPVKITKVDYRNGKLVGENLQVRYEYGGLPANDRQQRDLPIAVYSDKPVLVAMPSVVPAKEHTLHIQYNEFGQVSRVEETGWAPAVGELSASMMRRVTVNRYARINGRSVLVSTDGPMPGAEDAIRYTWDARADYQVGVTSPNGVSSWVLRFDEAGRPVSVAQQDGARYSETYISYSLDQVARRSTSAWLRRDGKLLEDSRLSQRSEYEYDFQHRLVAVVQPDGTRIRTEFGDDGRASKLVLPDGGQVVLVRDSSGRLIAAERWGDATTKLQTILFEQDASWRVLGLSDEIGQIVRLTYAGNEARPSIVERPDLAKTGYVYDAHGFITEQIRALSTSAEHRTSWVHDGAGNVTEIQRSSKQTAAYDDFGRKLAQADPQHGAARYVWDLANHLIAEANESGDVRRYRYDSAGRLISYGLSKQPEQVRTRFDGSLPVEVIDGGVQAQLGERKVWTYDSLGRIVEEKHWLPVIESRQQTKTLPMLFVTRLRYDEKGRISERRLVDAAERAHSMSYSWDDGSGHLRAIAYNGETVAKDIKTSWLGGLLGYSNGNGVHEVFDRDARGRLIRHAASIAGNVILDDNYKYNGSGRLIAASERLDKFKIARQYHYDDVGRLTSETLGDVDGGATFVYDGEGNRVQSVVRGEHKRYKYFEQRLVAMESSSSQFGSASFFGSRGQPVAQIAYQAALSEVRSTSAVASTPSVARTLYDASSGSALIAVGDHDEVVARYTWGLRGERVSKSVIKNGRVKLTYFLYQDRSTTPVISDPRDHGPQLQAEVDETGRLQKQYVYLDGQLVASIDAVANESVLAWLKDALLKWFGKEPDARADIYAIHTDQRYAPVAVSDKNGQVVWRAKYSAFGEAQVQIRPRQVAAGWMFISDAQAEDVSSYELNVRLPGQYWDAERGGCHNMMRDYDAVSGRYRVADPVSMSAYYDMGQSDRLAGGNVYAYVSGNPLTKIDPQGLYEQDIHYYMTFFLALAAGVDYGEARIIALAAQYIDDNPETKPFPSFPLAESSQKERLAKYHFTQDGNDPDKIVYHPSAEERAAAIKAGFPDPGDTTYEDDLLYAQRRILNPSNIQLDNLMAASNKAPTRCGQLQFFGEYLHAFEDTFGHRSKDNAPISVNQGLGHLVYGHEPDKTYNDTVYVSKFPGAIGSWDLREMRTLEAEKEVYLKMAAFSKGGAKLTWDQLEGQLKAYNSIHEEGNDAAKKFALLDKVLKGVITRPDGKDIKFSDGGAEHYNESSSEQVNNRNQFLCDAKGNRLKQEDYVGTILPSQDTPCTPPKK